MSWKTINQILGLASIDPKFRQRLQDNPLSAAKALGVELTSEELEIFSACASPNFVELCQCVFKRLAPHPQKKDGC